MNKNLNDAIKESGNNVNSNKAINENNNSDLNNENKAKITVQKK
jgi:hypothetical protein